MEATLSELKHAAGLHKADQGSQILIITALEVY